MNEKLNQWLAFIDDYDRGLIEVAKKNNKTIQKAKIEMDYLTGDEEVKRLAELREKWEMDYNSAISNAKEEGLKQGKIEIVKKLLKLNTTIKDIQNITGFTKDEIIKIEKENSNI